ncbi:MAG TPA: winged helix-turn-helix transcriptional regulator [Thermoplasmata archaeon]|nr:winged helix-turn-helix transcriptional regulator [Thermoplasmata archaeon]
MRHDAKPGSGRSKPTARTQVDSLSRFERLLGRTWCLRIITGFPPGNARFNRIRERFPGISAKTLSSSLRAMESLGIVARVRVQGPRTGEGRYLGYEMTEPGRELREKLEEFRAWADRFSK